MFDNSNTTQRVEIKPSCVGTLQKSHPKSFFKWFHINSNYRANYIDDNPRVLQIMVFGDNSCLAEILPESDYDNWIKEE